MRCDFDEMRWMDGRMDTYREIPDPKLWLCVESDTSAVHVSRLLGSRHCLQVASSLPGLSGQKMPVPDDWIYWVAFALTQRTALEGPPGKNRD